MPSRNGWATTAYPIPIETRTPLVRACLARFVHAKGVLTYQYALMMVAHAHHDRLPNRDGESTGDNEDKHKVFKLSPRAQGALIVSDPRAEWQCIQSSHIIDMGGAFNRQLENHELAQCPSHIGTISANGERMRTLRALIAHPKEAQKNSCGYDVHERRERIGSRLPMRR